MSNLKRTYNSKRTSLPSPALPSPPSSISSPIVGEKRKRPLEERLENLLTPATKQSKILFDKPKPKQVAKPKQKPKAKALTQLHFCIDQTTLRTCPLCALSYTKGAPDDESLHKAHCARVQKGMEWGREEEKEALKAGVTEVVSGAKLKNGSKGRIICFRADVGGKIGSKLSTLLDTINIALSSPPLTLAILQASKAYLFLIPSATTTKREKIIGCVIAQRISTAMAIATPECLAACEAEEHSTSSLTSKLVPVDASSGIFCHPAALPTPLGIPRLFVSSTHRRQSVASRLLTAAAETFVYGCGLDPRKGQVAFTQPTGDGNAVMRQWGGDGVRIYEE